jgi:hypothetical protein
LETILNRRSIRKFRRMSISPSDYLKIINILQEPIATIDKEDLEIYIIVNRVEGMTTDLYRNDRVLKLGDFSDRAYYLCVNQAIARDSAITLFFVSEYKNYQTALQLAGFIGQRLYLVSEYLGLSCTGIGAYYDDETQEFLGTTKDIIYALVIGIWETKMNDRFSRSFDDLPPEKITNIDNLLRRQLEVSIGENFYSACSNKIKILLSSCEWYFSTNASATTLVINCPDLTTSWSILHRVIEIAIVLEKFSASSKIRISPPIHKGEPFEIRVDEIDIYKE